MKKYFFILIMLLTLLTGCMHENEIEISMDEYQISFFKSFEVNDKNDYAFENIVTANGLEIYEIYNSKLKLNEEVYTYDSNSYSKLSTNEFDVLDLFLYKNNDIYPLSLAIDRKVVNYYEISPFLKDYLLKKETINEKEFGIDIIKNLHETNIINNNNVGKVYNEQKVYNRELEEYEILNEFNLNNYSYDWINVSASSSDYYINDILVAKYSDSNQKTEILNGIAYRKNKIENMLDNNNNYDTEFLEDVNNIIIWYSSMKNDEQIIEYIKNYIEKGVEFEIFNE